MSEEAEVKFEAQEQVRRLTEQLYMSEAKSADNETKVSLRI